MKLAIKQAQLAKKNGEVPIGAIIVNDNNIIASTYNMTITLNDPTAHAEMLAIKHAASSLCNSVMYTTLEPCPMCAQAISFAKIKRLYFGAYNPKGGGIDSRVRIFRFCNHVPDTYGGILESESSSLLKDFFKDLRNILN